MTDPADRSTFSRRNVLLAGLGTAVAAVLTACGRDGSRSGTSSPTTAAAPTTTSAPDVATTPTLALPRSVPTTRSHPPRPPGRTRHIHVRVQPPGGKVLTTQLYFPGEARNASDGIYRKECEVEMTDATDGRRATFTFVLDG